MTTHRIIETEYGDHENQKLLINSEVYEHRLLENIKKLYKSARKCDNQKQYKAIIEA